MTNELKQKYNVELDAMKGFVTRSVLASCNYKHYDSNTDIVSEANHKAIVATIVFSAKDYKPHAMLSVIVNGKETAFGTDTKKAIEFYNKAR